MTESNVEVARVMRLAALSDYFGTTITAAEKSDKVGTSSTFTRSLRVVDEFNQESDMQVTFVSSIDNEGNPHLVVTSAVELTEHNSRPSVAYLKEQLAKAQAEEMDWKL